MSLQRDMRRVDIGDNGFHQSRADVFSRGVKNDREFFCFCIGQDRPGCPDAGEVLLL